MTLAPQSTEQVEAPAAERRTLAYQPALDGLRALAVGAVIAYHLDWSWAPGGFLGVDAFFVLSGYLITTLLLTEHARTGTISLARFWARRARRLAPAMLLVCLAVGLYAGFVADEEVVTSLRSDVVAAVLYVANWHFIFSGQSYFQEFTDPSPLLHTWSLAIEEQFYLVWPLLVLVALRVFRGRRTGVWVLVVAGTIVSLWFMATLSVDDPSRAYLGTEARMHELLVGAGLALLLTKAGPALRERVAASQRLRLATSAVAVLSLLAVLAAMALVHDTSERYFNGGSFVFALTVAVLITALDLGARGAVPRVLSVPAIVWVGTVSYGLYLYHWPVIQWLNESSGLDGLALDAARIALMVALAAVSFRFIESPVRSGGLSKRLTPRRVAVVLPVAMAAVILTTYAVTADATEPVWAGGETGEITVYGDPAGAVTVAVVGDSIAKSLLQALDEEGKERGIRVVSGAWSGCGTAGQFQLDVDGATPFEFSEDCDNAIPLRYKDIAQQYEPDIVWVHSVRERFPLRASDGTVVMPGTPEHSKATIAGFEQSYAALAATGADVYWSTVVTRAQRFKGSCSKPENAERCAADDGSDGVYAAMNDDIAAFAAAAKGVKVFDFGAIVCPTGPPCQTEMQGVILRWDGSHFTSKGARIIAPMVLDQLLADSGIEVPQ